MMADGDKTKVLILTASYRIKGKIDLLPGARVTDFLDVAKDFIAVTDAEVYQADGSHILAAPFINISRSQIQIVTPI